MCAYELACVHIDVVDAAPLYCLHIFSCFAVDARFSAQSSARIVNIRFAALNLCARGFGLRRCRRVIENRAPETEVRYVINISDFVWSFFAFFSPNLHLLSILDSARNLLSYCLLPNNGITSSS